MCINDTFNCITMKNNDVSRGVNKQRNTPSTRHVKYCIRSTCVLRYPDLLQVVVCNFGISFYSYYVCKTFPGSYQYGILYTTNKKRTHKELLKISKVTVLCTLTNNYVIYRSTVHVQYNHLF